MVTLLFVILIVAYIGHACYYLFVQDDAFIFFRYAENWADGLGPVWNEGERVEGYSSPAWLAVLTLLRTAFSSFEPAVHWLTISLGVASLVIVFGLARAWTGSAWAGLAATILTAVDRTFALWSTSGMETRLFGFAVLAMVALAWMGTARSFNRALGLLFGCSLLLVGLSRPEGLLFVFVVLAYCAATSPTVLRTSWVPAGLAVSAAGIAIHLTWRWIYYGSLVPNTFFAKVSGVNLHGGLAYFTDFARSYALFAGATLLAMVWHLAVAIRKRQLTFCLALVALCGLFASYLVAIGGGFMEFRFLDVIVPIACLLLVTALWSVAEALNARTSNLFAMAVAVTIAAAHLNAGIAFEDSRHEVLTRKQMWDQTTRPWIAIGKWFRENSLPGESIATTAAGAIPYYSRLPCLDMHGLTDAHIAHLPAASDSVAHFRLAPDDYVSELGITFVINHPKLFSNPAIEALPPDWFFIRLDFEPGNSLYLAVRTTGDLDALLTSLADRGVVTVARH